MMADVRSVIHLYSQGECDVQPLKIQNNVGSSKTVVFGRGLVRCRDSAMSRMRCANDIALLARGDGIGSA